jgi:ribokinase
MSQKPTVISVIGSLNVDLVLRLPQCPERGETLPANTFDIHAGGKGANQAVACARLSRTKDQARNRDPVDVEVQMVGAVGNDEFANELLKSLEMDGVNVSKVAKNPNVRTGVASIWVEESTGDNRIAVFPGANASNPCQTLFDDRTDVVVFQLEIPYDVVKHNIEAAKRQRRLVSWQWTACVA